MKLLWRVGLVHVMLCVLTGCPSDSRNMRERSGAFTDQTPQPYVLQPGDTVEVKLFSHPELNETVEIRPDGRISLQLIDEVVAEGRTVAELGAMLTQAYTGRLRKPEVTVITRKLNALRVFVGGEVKRPGLLTLGGGMTCLQSIIYAGGFLNTAEPVNVVILRNQGTQTPEFLLVDLSADLAMAKNGNDVMLRSQDIVFVPKSRIAKLNQFVDQYIDKVIPFQRSLGVTYELNRRSP